VETVWLVAYCVILAASLVGTVLACWRYERLIQRWTNPPGDYLVEQAADAFKRGDNKGGNDLMAMKLAELKARAALRGSDADDYAVTDVSVTP